MRTLNELLQASAAMHRHLCPRQVVGVRMGVWAGELLGLDVPQADKRLLTIVETDGCAADGIAVATNCWVGRRTLRVEDYGKVAATFVDTRNEQAVRIVPRSEARDLAWRYATGARNKWEAQLLGYQRMPSLELLVFYPVRLRVPVREILSRAGHKAVCTSCGEEILNEREMAAGGLTLCRACSGEAYYVPEAPGGAELLPGSIPAEAIACN